MAALRGKVVTLARNRLINKISDPKAASCPVQSLVRRRSNKVSWDSPITCQGSRRLFCANQVKQQIPLTQEADNQDKIIDNPLKHDDYFDVKKLIKVEELFEAGVHYGHKSGVRNEYMVPYIYGSRMGVDILDLKQTVDNMEIALNFLAHIAYRGGVILFLTRQALSMPLVEKTAEEAGEYSHCRYWRGGTFTNAIQQFGSVTRLPDTCIFLSTSNTVFEQHTAIVESAKMMIPTIGIVDTNSDPRIITYPVPGNDDTLTSIELYCSLFKQAILKGKEKRKEHGL
ncbi:small ribosomal subunit protein uS2m-like [Ylistrum balloti]|uniref:small ribosomal subunit protein uS2m-like n=1 Tax=Ylistrum balloti TaxID=509963 RepID=UPI002905D517|nr:small ribosomal subunit protein uS2m-like [Ylistrum balloti]